MASPFLKAIRSFYSVPSAGILTYSLHNSSIASTEEEKNVAFSRKEWRPFRLVQVRELTADSKLFRFSLPSPEHQMGMKTASCIMVQGEGRTGQLVSRPYTPISTNDQKGFFDLIIKNYPEGNVSSYIHNLRIGEEVKVKGPYVSLEYKPNMFKRIGMIAGGSGLTPMLQICREILQNPEDTTEISLIFCNNTEEDVLHKAVLDQMQQRFHNFKVFYVVLEGSENWSHGIGYITLDMVEKKLPGPEEGTKIFVCGPPAMLEVVCGSKAEDYTQGELKGILKQRGYTPEQVFKF
mmetsp:Transcript_9676/g.12704  ORF Transcript_9676/g.12704 Transcript_9676/m.12704 type:complete len:293 (+) Transcript_9676:160-1038(+)|eukprot:CAMPEP_0117757432 /NCGR_PEP_ID=MMETSP0947-20121206/14732_1 /TAXON_ID=44440 /ORGANISM="Chattonella subsalsa, Strain CCMP2191" /LENGTH=292 /DNA_ID=CAMNT_0005577333 /DNA_START=47 /DNA_END=925 /DNA_ORIENTATION=-